MRDVPVGMRKESSGVEFLLWGRVLQLMILSRAWALDKIICNTLPHAGVLPARFFPHTDRESFPILLVKFGSCIVQETGRGSEVEQFTRNEQLQF